ncbi:peptidase C26 [Bacillus sp. MUM 116]|uniref:gamma-glutamyl-gamma-aminobutyrate hydrolase family protein n=1 Tax=Bacillus sp. MUM 116 TaxID=1678002 RepID=UPI0008F58C9D|nr:gamma-glutamyl-gamma-aminobutyrate hydrolase family protein [Bacillus sp. MUM 116]OIK10737.1 peptidase C26 [Bacillus sp. MUM 116]
MKPLIGFTTYYVSTEDKQIKFDVPQDHFMSALDDPLSIQKSGGIPIAIPVIDDEEYIDSILDTVDGLLLTGGSDLSPHFFGQPFKKGLGRIVLIRDQFEMKLIDKAIRKQLPILGICRGLQLLNVYFGGTLIQDMDLYCQTDINHSGSGYTSPKSSIAHKVSFPKDSIFYRCFGKDQLEVNSIHHQVVDVLGDGLEIAAISEDGMIEGIVHKDYPFIAAVQWHPEMMFEVHLEQLKVFEMFVNHIKDHEKPNKQKENLIV